MANNITFERVQDFEGVDYSYFELLSAQLPFDKKERFLNAVNNIINSDQFGSFDIIDEGNEAMQVARLFADKYDDLNASITTTDIKKYIDILTNDNIDLKSKIEIEVETLLENLGPAKAPITFLGNKYDINQNDINIIINKALRQNGSDMRLYLFYKKPDQTPDYIYGHMLDEVEVDIEGKKIWAILIGNVKVFSENAFSYSHLAFTNGDNYIFSIQMLTRGLLEEVQKEQKEDEMSPTNANLLNKVYEKFYHEMGGSKVSENILGAQFAFIIHEVGHILFSKNLGDYFEPIVKVFNKQLNHTTLKEVAEIYADLCAIRYIFNLHKENEASAERSFYSLALIRSMKFTGTQGRKADRVTLALLLSSLKVEKNTLKIDWERLEKLSSALQRKISNNMDQFSHVYFRACSMFPATIPEELLTPEKLKEECNSLRKIMIEKYKNSDPMTSNKESLNLANMALTIKALNIRDESGSQIYHSLIERLNHMETEINNWMVTELDFPKEYLPFK